MFRINFGLCGKAMKILILEKEQYLVESKDSPIIGRHYNLEDSETGTAAQNKAFHALIQEYFKIGMHSYKADNIADFKNHIKRNLGAGFEAYVYVEIKKPVMGMENLDRPIIKDAAKYLDIPEEIRKDPYFKELIRGRLKSWSNYTKKQRQKTMDNLIAEMLAAGVNSKKFNEIMEGMESDS